METEFTERDYLFALTQATGYLELGMVDDSWEELNSLPLNCQHRPEVLILRGANLLRMSRWEAAEVLTRHSMSLYPDIPDFYVQNALALDRLGRPEDAMRMWQRSPGIVKRTGIYHYNLARCESRLGNVTSARHHLTEAFRIDPGLRESARHDPALKPIVC